MKKRLKITLNAPLVLGFALACTVVTLPGALTGESSTAKLFCTYAAPMDDPLTYLRLVTHVLGHAGMTHLLGNMAYILLLGPMLEEKYGWKNLLAVILVTAVITGVIHNLLFPRTMLLGASGVVFAMILLSSSDSADLYPGSGDLSRPADLAGRYGTGQHFPADAYRRRAGRRRRRLPAEPGKEKYTEVLTMNANIVKRNELLAQKVIKGLQSRNMTGYYAATKEEALARALSLIPEGSSVTMGGAMSAHEIGLVEALKAGNYRFIDRDAMADKRAAMLAAYDADFFLTSANAMTEDGEMVNIDGNANRVSAIAQGPKKVLVIVGMNKICGDLDGAMKRARNVAAPINAQRFGLNTPCAKTGACMNCKSPDTICCQFLITRFSRHADRIHVILVNDELGF